MTAVGIVGYGRFGQALASLLAKANVPWWAYDPRFPVPAPHRADSPGALAQAAELLALCVPVTALEDSVNQLLPHLRRSHVVFDVGSVKVKPVQILSRLLGREVPWVGTHPLFGPRSLEDPSCVLRVVVCPNPDHPDATQRTRALFRQLGCEIVELSADAHDRAMAKTHALTYFIARGLKDVGCADTPIAPASFRALSKVVEIVETDGASLFNVVENDNPYAKDARRELMEALRRIETALEEEA